MKGRPIYRYEPNNSNPDRAVGILLPFNKAAEGRVETQNELSGSVDGGSLFRQSYTTEEQALSNFRNLLMTRFGERYMQPKFGTMIHDMVFEPNTELVREQLQASIEDSIKFWLPYIRISDLSVTIPEAPAGSQAFVDRLHGISVQLTVGLLNNTLDERTIVLEIKAD